MKTKITGLLLLVSQIVFAQEKNTPILIEAESFQNKGGWMVDPQFVEQIGSPYLLAHGWGEPVVDALTSFRADGRCCGLCCFPLQ